MSQPPPDNGNVVEPDVFAARRARRAEVSEDATLELRLFEAERRLAEVVVERDTLRTRIDERERDLRSLRQREWSEQQQRLEAQGEAAVTREVAAEQVATLRSRLVTVETELAVVTEERDRAREELARERAAVESEHEALRAAARSDRELREALESEHEALREEVERRGRLAREAAAAVAEARREMEASRRSGAWAARDLERRLVEERSAFAARVEAVEAAVAAVRERFGAAARVLREKFEAERAGRVAAERALASAQVHIASLEAEVAALREGDARRLAELTSRVESVQAAAAQVRVDASLRAAVEAMQARVAELQAGVAAAAGLREELEVERAARWVAEAELDAERRRGDEDRAARAQAEARLAEVEAAAAEVEARASAQGDEAAPAEAERDEAAGAEALAAERAARAEAEARLAELEAEIDVLRAAGEAPPAAGPDPEALASLRAALEGLRTVEPAEAAAPALAVDLAAAAERLRAAVEAHEPEPEPALDTSRDESSAPGAEDSSLDGQAPVEPAASVAPPPPAAPAAPAAPARAELPLRAPVVDPGPWLRDALVALAAEEPEIAELLFVSLLPAQAGVVKKPLAYDLAIAGGTTHRVTLDGERGRVELPDAAPAEVRVSGPLAALVPLATGGAARRLPGAQIEGRRHLRRLLKARRAPLGLGEMAAAGVAPSPGLLLTVLARAVDPSWTTGHTFTVDIAPEGADRWRVVAHRGAPLSILPAGEDGAATATLHTAPGRLASVLAGIAPAPDAHVEGDVRAVRTLLGWLDRAQRGRR